MGDDDQVHRLGAVDKMSNSGTPSTEPMDSMIEIKTVDIVDGKNMNKCERTSGEKGVEAGCVW